MGVREGPPQVATLARSSALGGSVPELPPPPAPSYDRHSPSEGASSGQRGLGGSRRNLAVDAVPRERPLAPSQAVASVGTGWTQPDCVLEAEGSVSRRLVAGHGRSREDDGKATRLRSGVFGARPAMPPRSAGRTPVLLPLLQNFRI